ncbi:MAG: Gfo/Idh/MocA family oxidoreductase [Planctomycetes bacterium]|nr:Gfo/Idh/MocA family oxidoreductase [Planctomycetota bacterium]
MPKRLKAAHIGLQHGHAKGLMGTFKQLCDLDLVAFCEENDPRALEALRVSEPQACLYSSLDDLLAKEEFDVACVTLPCNELPQAGVRLARAGRHFLMNKQFARTAEDLRPLVQAVSENRVKVLAYYPWRRHPAVMALKGLLDSGKLGRPLAALAQLVTTQVGPGMRNPRDMAYRADTEGGGILHMEGGHWLEALRFLLGCEVRAVSALCRPVVGNMRGENMEDVSVVGLEFESGAVVNLHMGYLQALGGAKESGLSLWGSEGSAQWAPMGDAAMQVRYRADGRNVEQTLTFELPPRAGVYGGQQWLFDVVEEFMQAIREDREPAVTAVDACRVLKVIDAAYESSRTGRRVEIAYSHGTGVHPHSRSV